MRYLKQPIDSTNPENGHDAADVYTLRQYLDLLRQEEDYWSEDLHNTKLLISRLRKIYYDKWGWNSELIRGAADVETRYVTTMTPTPVPHGKGVVRRKQLITAPEYRLITYSDHDRVYGSSRAGQVPLIYQHDHQELRLPDGAMCDIAHVLAGIDAYNHFSVVTPLPEFLKFLYRLLPYCKSNVDVVTWLGDIASSSADFLFDYLKNGDKEISEQEEQTVIDSDAPGSDMMGDIDPYVIAKHYQTGATNGLRFTEIIEDYYFGNNLYRSQKYLTYAELIGLKNFDGKTFQNEQQWLNEYDAQLRNAITFVIFSQTEMSLRKFLLPLCVWVGMYKKPLKIRPLLEIYLKSLKSNIDNLPQ